MATLNNNNATLSCPGVKDDYKHLDELSNSTTPAESARIYDKWAEDYEQDTAGGGYVSHAIVAGQFDLFMEKVFSSKYDRSILDVCAGTGIVGSNLQAMGYRNITALDVSKKMLEIAAKKGIYTEMICHGIGDGDDKFGAYDALICSSGVYTGQIKPQGLKSFIENVKPGGVICFNVEKTVYDDLSSGYQHQAEELLQAKLWKRLHKEIADHHVYIPERSKCYVFVYQVNEC